MKGKRANSFKFHLFMLFVFEQKAATDFLSTMLSKHCFLTRITSAARNLSFLACFSLELEDLALIFASKRLVLSHLKRFPRRDFLVCHDEFTALRSRSNSPNCRLQVIELHEIWLVKVIRQLSDKLFEFKLS